MHKIYYLLENFCGASGRGHHVLYTASYLKGKLLQKTTKIFPLEGFAVYDICICAQACLPIIMYVKYKLIRSIVIKNMTR